MRRSLPIRLLALVIALLVSLAAPGLALAHGLTHAHLAHEHAEHRHAGRHDDAHAGPSGRGENAGPVAPVLAPMDHGHDHVHPALDVAPGARELVRLDLTVGPLAIPEPPAALATLVVVHAPALADRALLARPDPASGPPPKLRAPPAR